jgi:hypothetical protein
MLRFSRYWYIYLALYAEQHHLPHCRASVGGEFTGRSQVVDATQVVTTSTPWVYRFLAWLNGRPVLKIRIVEDNPAQQVGGLVFEVENASPTATSLVPIVRSRSWFPRNGRYRKGETVYDVRELDRKLPPFQPQMFSASAQSLPSGYGHSWFRTYEFQPRRGPRTRVRIRNAKLEPLGIVRFTFELWRFRLSGRVQKATPGTIADWQARRRSKGPH